MSEQYWNPQIETAPVYEMKALQSYRLSAKIKQVYDNVPHYRAKMDEMGVTPDDIRSVEDLHKLPFTTKQDLRDTYPYGMFARPIEEVVRIHASSGTTGKQTVVGYTDHDIDIWSECTARALTAAGGAKNDFVHVSYGYGLFTGGFGLHCGAEKIKATVIPVSVGNTKRQIQIMKDFGSTILCCTPSYALYLGETLEEMGVDKSEIHLKAGIFGAEPWTEGMRREIEKKLGIKAFDIYGLSEVIGPGVAFECSEQTGMHINEDHFIPEIIDPDTGEVLPEGEQGELVFTAITKEALPLMRYRTKDIAVLSRKQCSCGRTLIKLSKPQGRSDDMLIIRGVNVFPSQVESVLMDLGLTAPHYVLIVDRVDNKDRLEIKVEMAEEMFSDAVRHIEDTEGVIQRAVESTLGISAKVTLVETQNSGTERKENPSGPLTTVGTTKKCRRVISDLFSFLIKK